VRNEERMAAGGPLGCGGAMRKSKIAMPGTTRRQWRLGWSRCGVRAWGGEVVELTQRHGRF
jgi:hypothetical protein